MPLKMHCEPQISLAPSSLTISVIPGASEGKTRQRVRQTGQAARSGILTLPLASLVSPETSDGMGVSLER